MIKNVSLIGIGIMGKPMARHLMEAGYNVTIYYHRDPAKMQSLLDLGAKCVTDVKELAKDADVLIAMLPTEHVVYEMLIEGGIMDHAKPGCIVVNAGTNSPESNMELGELLIPRGFQVIDAPVAGSGLQAEAKTIVFIAGGDKPTYDKLVPLFEAMGKDCIYAGALGSASYAKLATNTMMAINYLSFSEALTMAVKSGVDPEVFVRFTSGGGAQSAVANNKIGRILDRNFDPTFRGDLLHKDIILASNLARDLKLPLPMMNLAKEMYSMSVAEGYGAEDYGAVLKCYENWAGITIEK